MENPLAGTFAAPRRATTVAELAELVGLIEQDPGFNVVVFDSVNHGLAHCEVEHDPSRTAAPQ